MSPEDETSEDLPRSLIDALKSTERPLPLITARVDREVSAMARAQFAGRRPRKLRPAWWAAAASLVVAVLVLQLQDPGAPVDGPVYADIDQSGRIDIADVLALARTSDADPQKLDAFAMRIVSLNAGSDAL